MQSQQILKMSSSPNAGTQASVPLVDETINDWQNVTRFANINISEGSIATHLR